MALFLVDPFNFPQSKGETLQIGTWTPATFSRFIDATGNITIQGTNNGLNFNINNPFGPAVATVQYEKKTVDDFMNLSQISAIRVRYIIKQGSDALLFGRMTLTDNTDKIAESDIVLPGLLNVENERAWILNQFVKDIGFDFANIKKATVQFIVGATFFSVATIFSLQSVIGNTFNILNTCGY